MQTPSRHLESGPSADEVVQAARALAPDLAGRARETTEGRRVAAENVYRIKQARLHQVLLPRHCGGLELDLHTHLNVVEELAAGCGSTGWCTGVWHAHTWLLGLFARQAQDEFTGGTPQAIISAVISPRGEAGIVDGGYLLSGFWPFCSGVHHSEWVLLGARVVDERGHPAGEGLMLLPTLDVEIKDDWYVNGLTGTGSNSVSTKDVFVPRHRFLSVPDAVQGNAPGAGLHESSLYSSAFVPALALFLCGPALGMARHALDVFCGKLPGRVVAYTFNEQQADMPVTHLEVAEAATKIDTARLLLHALVDTMQNYAGRGELMPVRQRAKARMDCAYAVRLCMEAAETLFLAGGGVGLSEANPLQVAARDLQAVNMHGLLVQKTNLEMYGRMLLGLEPNSPVI